MALFVLTRKKKEQQESKTKQHTKKEQNNKLKKKNFKANTDKVTEVKSHYYQLIGYQH